MKSWNEFDKIGKTSRESIKNNINNILSPKGGLKCTEVQIWRLVWIKGELRLRLRLKRLDQDCHGIFCTDVKLVQKPHPSSQYMETDE